MRSLDGRRFPQAKTWFADGRVGLILGPDGKPIQAQQWHQEQLPVGSLRELGSIIQRVSKDPKACVIRGVLDAGAAPSAKGTYSRIKTNFADTPHYWVLIDCDSYEPIGGDPVVDGEAACREFIAAMLPQAFHEVDFFWQLSSSAGARGKEHILKAHLWFWLDQAVDCGQLSAWTYANKLHKGLLHDVVGNAAVDITLFRQVQQHYIAAPVCEPGVVAAPERFGAPREGFCEGLADEVVRIDWSAFPVGQTRATKRTAARALSLEGEAADPVLVALNASGWLIGKHPDGGYNMVCPFEDEHGSQDNRDDDTRYWPENTGTRDYKLARIFCSHNSCAGRSHNDFLETLGLGISDDFEDLTTAELGEDGSPSDGAVGDWPVEPPSAVEWGAITKANHLATDMRNMNRIAARFKTKVLFTAGVWYTWKGTHWDSGKQGVELMAQQLSGMVLAEAQLREKKAKKLQEQIDARDTDASLPDKIQQLIEVADDLKKWSVRCEMASTQANAINMLEASVTINKDVLNKDPWLLNCPNGTVDLRTGELREHRPEDYITTITPVDYVPDAQAPVWEATLARITVEEGRSTKPLVNFLQRWFGYCATGSTREQKFLVHWGNGSNGKTTILEAITSVLGSGYTTTAPIGLLVARKTEAHHNEIADLYGQRMVTAHESEDGAVLKEGFVKQATGSDRLKGRFLYSQFFEFSPTHKLQLLTNHKPQVRGGDTGIWRRVLLMPYVTKFGTPAEVDQGTHQWVKDNTLPAKLLLEQEGILAWIVRGAVTWNRDGLNPPDAVTVAVSDYRDEQNRMIQFIRDKCELGLEFEAALGSELYVAYQAWARESGIYPVSKIRFTDDLEQVVPGFKRHEKPVREGTKSRNVLHIVGLRLAENEL